AAWLQVVVGTLGVVPAWLAGARLGGVWGGFIAALVVGMNFAFLDRSLGADNDVWNVVLPLGAAAALLAALDGSSTPRRLAWAAAAATCIGLHAAIWSGWPLAFVGLAAGIVACVAVSAAGNGSRGARGGMPSDTRGLAVVGA